MTSATNPIPRTIASGRCANSRSRAHVAPVDAEQHDHEQEQHHDRAGVDDDLHREQERRVQQQVHHREAEEVHHEEQRRVHGVAHQQHRDRRARRRSARRPRTRRCPAAPTALLVDRIGAERRRRLQQLLLRPDRVLARGERHLVVVRQRQRARRARLDAQAAHDAAQVVDLVVLRVALARADRVLRVVVRALHPDRVGRAGEGAQLAPDALLQAVVVAVEQVAPDVGALRGRHDLLRVLLGVVAPEGLLEDRAHALGDRTAADPRDGALGSDLVAHVPPSSSRGIAAPA